MLRQCRICDTPLKPSQQKFCSRQCTMKGIDPRQKTSLDTYIKDVIRVKEELGHYPSNAEYLIHGDFHPATLWKYFGAWSKVLEIAGYKEPPEKWTINDITPEDGGWLAGIFAGDGHLSIQITAKPPTQRFAPLISLSQREDNYYVIEEIIRLWNLEPKICKIVWRGQDKYKKYIRRPTLQFAIRDIHTLFHRVLPTFHTYPLRTKKHKEFEIFSKAIELLMQRRKEHRYNRPYTDHERKQMLTYSHQLKKLKKYKEPNSIPLNITTYIGKTD